MADRFERLFELPSNLYSASSPVIVVAGALLKDTQTGNIIVQLKYQSVSSATIKAVKVSISAYDVAGKELEDVIEYQYLDIHITNGQTFGSNKAIVMPNKVTRSFALSNITIVLLDGSTHSVQIPMKSLPNPKPLSSLLNNTELITQYQLEVNSSAKYAPQSIDSIWSCSCGTWNSGRTCHHCGATQNTVTDALNVTVLTDNLNARLTKEKALREEKERREEAARQEAEKQRILQEERRQASQKKLKAVLSVTVPIVSIVLIFALWLYPKVIVPGVEYNKATELLVSGQFDAATSAFENLGDYKDSADKALEAQYQKAEQLVGEQKYLDAASIFENLGDYKDSAEKSLEAQYQRAEQLFYEQQYIEAASIFNNIFEYKDAKERVEEIHDIVCTSIYEEANSLLLSGDTYNAAFAFGQLGDYKDARIRSKTLWATIVSDSTLSVGYNHSIAIKENGEVIATGSNEFGQLDVENWKNIISVSAGWEHSVGLCADGSVVATGDTNKYVQNWNDIVAVSAGGYHTVGLKSDGTVVAVGSNSEGQCDVQTWKNIIAISAGQRHTVGLCADGSVVATGYNDNGQCYVSNWENIVYISANMYRTIGVKADGTVVAVGDNDHGQGNVDDWENIVSVASTRDVTFGLKKDGTVVACGYNYKDICEIDDWKDIVIIATNGDSVVGVTSGGYVLEKGVYRHLAWSGIRISDNMLSRVDSLSSKITGIDFGEEGYVEYTFVVDGDSDNAGTNTLRIYKNGAISLTRTKIRGGGLGPSTRLFLNEQDDIAAWNADTRTFTVAINDEITCAITILEDGALLSIVEGECDWGIEGKYIQ